MLFMVIVVCVSIILGLSIRVFPSLRTQDPCKHARLASEERRLDGRLFFFEFHNSDQANVLGFVNENQICDGVRDLSRTQI